MYLSVGYPLGMEFINEPPSIAYSVEFDGNVYKLICFTGDTWIGLRTCKSCENLALKDIVDYWNKTAIEHGRNDINMEFEHAVECVERLIDLGVVIQANAFVNRKISQYFIYSSSVPPLFNRISPLK